MSRRKDQGPGRVFFEIGLALALLLCLAALVPGYQRIRQRQRDITRLEEQKAEGQAVNDQLGCDIHRMDDDEYIEQVARDQLRLVRPGETIFVLKPAPDQR